MQAPHERVQELVSFEPIFADLIDRSQIIDEGVTVFGILALLGFIPHVREFVERLFGTGPRW